MSAAEDDDLEEAEYRAAREVLEDILGSLPSRFMVLLELHRLVIADSQDVIVDKWEKADRLLDLYNLVPEEWRLEEFDPDQMDRLIESLTPFMRLDRQVVAGGAPCATTSFWAVGRVLGRFGGHSRLLRGRNQDHQSVDVGRIDPQPPGPAPVGGQLLAALRLRRIRMLRPVRSAASASDSNGRRDLGVVAYVLQGQIAPLAARHGNEDHGVDFDRQEDTGRGVQNRARCSRHAARPCLVRTRSRRHGSTSLPARRAGSRCPTGSGGSLTVSTTSRAAVPPKPLLLLRTRREQL